MLDSILGGGLLNTMPWLTEPYSDLRGFLNCAQNFVSVKLRNRGCELAVVGII